MSTYFGGNIPWVKSGELGDGHVFDTEETLSELGLKSSNAKLFPKGTLCIALYGATVGKLGILEVDAATNQAVCGLFLPDEVHRDFVFYYLASIRRHLIEQGKGGAQSNISNGLVRQTRIPIAPLNEQRRIVAKIEELFSDLDAGVAALKRAKANLKRYRASVLKSAVEGKLTEQWRAKHPAIEPASALLARILLERRQKWEADQLAKFAATKKEPPKNWRDKYVEPTPPDTTGLPELPEGWYWASVEQVAQFTRYGSSAKTNEEDTGVPVIRMGNIIDGTLDYSELKFLPHGHPEFPDLLLTKGDLLFNRTNSAELVGKSAVYDGQHDPCSFASYLISVRCLAGCDPGYLCYYINSTYGRRWVKSVVSQQVGQANVNGSKLQSLAFPLPSVAEQVQIVTDVAETLSQIEAAANAIDQSLLRAARLRQSILKRAFEGKLVPQDPKDEPASALLERLRASRTHDEANGTAATSKRTRAKIKESSGEPRTRIRRRASARNQQEE
jgi:type I restriction enzyme S subunit